MLTSYDQKAEQINFGKSIGYLKAIILAMFPVWILWTIYSLFNAIRQIIDMTLNYKGFWEHAFSRGDIFALQLITRVTNGFFMVIFLTITLILLLKPRKAGFVMGLIAHIFGISGLFFGFIDRILIMSKVTITGPIFFVYLAIEVISFAVLIFNLVYLITRRKIYFG